MKVFVNVYILSTSSFDLYNVCTICIHDDDCTLYSVHCTIVYTVKSEYCTLYTVYCKVYSVHSV